MGRGRGGGHALCKSLSLLSLGGGGGGQCNFISLCVVRTKLGMEEQKRRGRRGGGTKWRKDKADKRKKGMEEERE